VEDLKNAYTFSTVLIKYCAKETSKHIRVLLGLQWLGEEKISIMHFRIVLRRVHKIAKCDS